MVVSHGVIKPIVQEAPVHASQYEPGVGGTIHRGALSVRRVNVGADRALAVRPKA
jgi:hypothetical protein